MNIKKSYIILAGILLASFVVSIWVYPDMPDKMASHFNAKGQVDGYMPKSWGLFLMPIILSAVALLFIVIPRLDPLKANIEKFRKHYDGFVILFSVFMLSIHLQVILWNYGIKISPNVILPLGLGLLFFYIGILCEHSKRNWFIGIRTPWTLSSEIVWDKTHKVGGRLFKIAAVVTFAGVFFQQYAIFFILVPVLAVAVYTLVYSYLEYRKTGPDGSSKTSPQKAPPASGNETWDQLKADYLRKVEKALSSVSNPRRKEVLEDVSSHLDRRFAELGADRQRWEDFQTIITEMGPPSDYAELLADRLPAKQNILSKHPLWTAIVIVLVIAAVVKVAIVTSVRTKPVTPEQLRQNFPQKVAKLNIDAATLKDVIRTFGEPIGYIWGLQLFDKGNLPQSYIVRYPSDFSVFIRGGRVVELRYESNAIDYLFHSRLKVGSSLEEVLNVVGQPKKIVEGGKNLCEDGVLYKDVEGRKGYCYYGRADQNVRFFFGDYKVTALYVTRSDFTAAAGMAAEEISYWPVRKIDRRPKPRSLKRGTLKSVPKYNPDSTDPFQVDLRGYDLWGLDLKDSLDNLLHADFDDGTIWPGSENMPEDFDWKKIMELGKNPGLGVRDLHKNGITGKSVGIAIIDNPLLVDHKEYVEHLRLYEEINVIEMKGTEGGHGADAHMHGAAVVSIAAGNTLGVAPQADIYYIAAWPYDWNENGNGVRPDFKRRAQAVNRILEINQHLPKDRKIRAISMSIGWDSSQEGYKEITDAMQKAKQAGMLVICSSTEQVHGFKFHGLGRSPLANPDDFNSYRPGLFWAKYFYTNTRLRSNDRLLVPMDSRTTASPTGADEYVFYSSGGWSWSIPYIAGMYALCCQVDLGITPERFWALAMKTGRTIELENKGEKIPFGPILNPAGLIDALKAGELSDSNAVSAELARYKTADERPDEHAVIDSAFQKDFNAKVAQLNIDTATLDDIIRIFGEPIRYAREQETFTKDNLPSRYAVYYPNNFSVVVNNGRIDELRFEGAASGYVFRNRLKVGSSLEEVFDFVGQPTETIVGEAIQIAKTNVLYKDINGRKGWCYYHRPDHNVRFFFMDYKVSALYVTRSN